MINFHKGNYTEVKFYIKIGKALQLAIKFCPTITLLLSLNKNPHKTDVFTEPLTTYYAAFFEC